MAIVRVIIWDEENFLQRISNPEDTFLIESIDASGSDSNVLKIAPLTASAVIIGNSGVATFISGVLSGNFITGTFYGDGSQLRGLVTTLNQFTGSITLVGGANVQITSGTNPNEITISAVSGAASADEKVKVTSNDTTSNYLYSKLVEGKNVHLVEQNDGGNETLLLSASVTSINGYSGSVSFVSASDFLRIGSGSNQIVLTASHRPIDQLVHNIAENSYEEFTYSGILIVSATLWTSPAKTVKIREENFIYDGFRIATSSLIQFNAAGTEVERLTQKYTYSGIAIVSITGTLT